MKWVCIWCDKLKPTSKMYTITRGFSVCTRCAKKVRRQGLQKL